MTPLLWGLSAAIVSLAMYFYGVHVGVKLERSRIVPFPDDGPCRHHRVFRDTDVEWYCYDCGAPFALKQLRQVAS